jgi:molecular chaperone DnaK
MTIVGIDLGTTNSAIAYVNEHGRPQMIANREGEYVTPSVVFFDGSEPIVGSIAKRSAVLDPLNVVQFVKRHMGDSSWMFATESGETFSAEDISGLILKRLKEDAETMLGRPVERAVISVPAYFQDAPRQATKDAGKIAGLDVVRIINEPTAAALAYGIESGGRGKVVVYDLGGGTFDVTVLDLAPSELTVLATGGDRNLGGFNWDNEIMSWLNEQFMAAGGPDLMDDPRTEQDLRDRAETAKITLSSMPQTKVILSADGFTKTIVLDRPTFADISHHLLDETEVIFSEVIEEAGLLWNEVNKILLVGGSTRMPAVAELIERVSGLKPSRELHPDEVVALGASLQAAMLEPPAAPAATVPGPPRGPVSAAAGLPATSTDIVELKKITDVTAHSLGLLLVGDDRGTMRNFKVVDRGTPLPCSATNTSYAFSDGQTSWRAQVTQGEDENPEYVTVIGEGMISFPQPRPKGYPTLSRFSYDLDGILHVMVYDGMTQQLLGELHIKKEGNLTESEVEEKRQRMAAMAVD